MIQNLLFYHRIKVPLPSLHKVFYTPLSQTKYCILYAKQYIYLEKLEDKIKYTSFNVDFLGYLSHLKKMY